MKQLFLQRANARNQSIVLAMVCLVLLFTDIRYTYLQPVRAFAGTLTEPVFWLSELPSRLLEGMRVLSQDRSDRLGQLAVLEQKIKVLEARQLKMSALASENRRLRELLGSSEKLDESVLIAEVVGISPDPARHYVMIDKGADDGSFIGQVVIDSTGLVGQVIETTASLSKVLLITDQRHAVPVISLRTLAQLVAEGTGRFDRVSLPHVPESLDIQQGDVLVTSGLGQRFPKGYPVARVARYELVAGDAFASVMAQPLSGLQTLDYVLLVFDREAPQAFAREILDEENIDG